MTTQAPPSAFGQPGIEPRWTSSAKEAVVTAYSQVSRVWCTLSHGIVNEVYYGTVDHPQTRDMQFLFTDGDFFHEEKRDLEHEIQPLDDTSLGRIITSRDPEGRYSLTKEIIVSPHESCLLLHGRLEGREEVLRRLQVFLLLAPHVDCGGRGNTGWSLCTAGRAVLAAHRGGIYMAVTADVPLGETSCGFVGRSDGYTDIREHKRMEWQFRRAEEGNIALTARLNLADRREFRVVVGFGETLHEAVTETTTVLSEPYARQRRRFCEQWKRLTPGPEAMERFTDDGGKLYRHSHRVLVAHEDKKYAGGFVASMSIPWGASKGDEDRGGYHLVWVRDAVHVATAFLAMNDLETARRVLVYLACSQREDGGFSQNFWIDGNAYSNGQQLDQVAFPCLLAWRLWKAGGLDDFDPYATVMSAARYLLLHGPATQQDRWEEISGYTPSTLAVCISALICAADFAADRGNLTVAKFLMDYADYTESNIEGWTTTESGDLVPGIRRHYIRCMPACEECTSDFDPATAGIWLANQPPGSGQVLARRIVCTDFLDLVRYGIRSPQDPLVLDSLRVIDALLKVDFPGGPCWRRYNHDGYGEHEDGSDFDGTGVGRPWPLLTGERGHYEMAAGNDPGPFLHAMESFQGLGGLLSEQIWDADDIPSRELLRGKPTRGARPLLWAHAEYITLLRSAADGRIFDQVPQVADRYLGRKGRRDLQIWKFNRRLRFTPRGTTVRLLAEAPFRLRWTQDGWSSAGDAESQDSRLGLYYVDLPTCEAKKDLRFTFYWPQGRRWEGSDFCIDVTH